MKTVNVTRNTSITKSVTLDEDELVDILRKHFNMPRAGMYVNAGYDRISSITLSEVEQIVTNE